MSEVNKEYINDFVPAVTISQEEYRDLLLAKVINNMILNMFRKKEYLSDSFLAAVFGIDEEEE
jgi:hypothetical protein